MPQALKSNSLSLNGLKEIFLTISQDTYTAYLAMQTEID